MGINLLKPVELLLTAFVVSFITSQGRISGTFLLFTRYSHIFFVLRTP